MHQGALCKNSFYKLSVAFCHDVEVTFNLLFYIVFLLFRYAPLGMSLHAAVADISCRNLIP
jgi:hypothetical protein